MASRVGMLVGDLVEAGAAGARFVGLGYAVRVLTERADLERLPELFATSRTDVAVIVTGGSPERESNAATALQRSGARLVGEAAELGSSPEPYVSPAAVEPDARAGVLVLSGSFAPAARSQVERLADEGALVLTIHREAVLNQDESFLMGVRSGAAAAIKQGRNVVVRSENWPEAAVITRKLASKRFIPVEEIERRVLGMLARAAEGVVDASACRRLVVVGTDTGAAVCSQLGVMQMTALAEIAPGVPGLLVPGTRPLLLAVKAGGTGTPDTLVACVKQMRGA